MQFLDHLGTTWTAIKRWILAQTQDAIVIGILWLVGLWIIDVPFAPLWAFLGMLFQFVPHLGTVLALVGPAIAAGLSGGWQQLVFVLILYAVIVTIDALVLQPMLMKHTAKVPLWASILTPLFLGLVLNVWALLFAPLILAVIYAFKEKREKGIRLKK